jgi:hypothetical protein
MIIPSPCWLLRRRAFERMSTIDTLPLSTM